MCKNVWLYRRKNTIYNYRLIDNDKFLDPPTWGRNGLAAAIHEIGINNFVEVQFKFASNSTNKIERETTIILADREEATKTMLKNWSSRYTTERFPNYIPIFAHHRSQISLNNDLLEKK